MRSLIFMLLPPVALICLQCTYQPGGLRFELHNLPEEEQPPISRQLLQTDSGNWVPKIAFLFLVRGEIHHEGIWRRFFEGFENRYSVYVHTRPEYRFPSESFFAGRQLEAPIRVVWGSASVVQAEMRLLLAAFDDPLNKQFVLLSEACIPIRSFQTVYKALVDNTRSVIDACNPQKQRGMYVSPEKPVPKTIGTSYTFQETPLDSLSKELASSWRSSTQWFVLTRQHAILVVKERQVLAAFRKHCRNLEWGRDRNEQCVGDENYIPTLLAFKGRAEETTCQKGPTVTLQELSSTTQRLPRSFSVQEITPALVWQLRGGSCPVDCKTEGGQCRLFARKFPKGTERRVAQVVDILFKDELKFGIGFHPEQVPMRC